MKHLTLSTTVLAFTAILAVGGVASAQTTGGGLPITTTGGLTPGLHAHTINPQKKAQSDAAMQAGLQNLQAAAGAEQSSNAAGAGQDLQQAIASFTSALPIYHGYREKAIGHAKRALTALSSTKKNAQKASEEATGRAIQDAQTALSTN